MAYGEKVLVNPQSIQGHTRYAVHLMQPTFRYRLVTVLRPGEAQHTACDVQEKNEAIQVHERTWVVQRAFQG